MKRLMICSALLLAGCDFFDNPVPPPEKKEVVILLSITDDLPRGQYGQATTANGICTVKINTQHYPRCITHEVMHCLGWQHDNRPNIEFCDEF